MQKIAVIGTACLFPEANTPDIYWQNLLHQKDSRTPATKAQIGRDPQDYFEKDKGVKDKYYCTLGGYIHHYQFDSKGYQLPANHLDDLDYSFQWSLQTAKEALKDAGYADQLDVLQQTGLILANLSFPTKESNKIFLPLYQKVLAEPLKTLLNAPDFTLEMSDISQNLHNGGIAGMPASITAQALGLGKVYFGLDAACASSLYSIKIACAYLLSGKANLMLAGAVSAGDPWFVSMGFSVFNAFPQNIASQPLDQHSKGLNTGEGAGYLVLKRYDDAIRDGDNIQAVIDGIGLSNDGRGKFVLSPNKKGQITCFDRAYSDAGTKIQDLDYIECHATGTPLGDETEIQSMADYFADKNIHFSIGSAKSNFGHLLTAAGMAGIQKLILALKNEAIPATIGVKDPMQSTNPKIAGEHILRDLQPWKKTKKARQAGISAFGFGGTNAHVVISEDLKKKKPVKTKIIPAKPLSIIGMGAYFGTLKNLAEFEQAIYKGQQPFTEIPENRWQGVEKQAQSLKDLGLNGKPPQGNYIDQFDFDYLYFKIPPEEKAPLIPQQLLMIKVLDEALKDAKLATGGNVGVIVAMEMDLSIHQFRGRVDTEWAIKTGLEAAGITLSAIQQQQLINLTKDSFHNAVEINQFTSFIGNIIPCRICSLWDFSGPAFTISAEENSAFKAIEMAKLFLESGDVEAMVVGAVDLSACMEAVYLQNLRADLNPDEPYLAFAENKAGWNIGEGAGAIVLKRADQLDKGQKAYANIGGLAIENKASARSLQKASTLAMKQAKVKANQIELIELNSSGIAEQDAIELATLENIGCKNAALGSIKANIGHTFAASGLAGIIKTALCIQSGFIPAIPNWQKAQKSLDWAKKGFYFPVDSRPWLNDGEGKKRVAAVNSLGYDQSCGQCILVQADTPSRENNALADPDVYLFLFAADDGQSLEQQLHGILDVAEKIDLNTLVLQQLERFEAVKKADYRLSILAKNPQDLIRETQSALKSITPAIKNNTDWSTPFGSYFTPNPQAEKGEITFVYPGGFNSYQGMVQQLFYLFPELQDQLKDSTKSLRHMMRANYMYPQTIDAPDRKTLKAVEAAMGEDAIAMFESGITTCIAFTKVIQDLLGIKADSAFGHSMGELSMLFASGTWSNTTEMSETLHSTATFKSRLVDEMDVVRQAWDLPPQKKGEAPIWGTYTLRVDAKTAEIAIAKEARVYLIMINAPKEIVIAGDDAACQRVVKSLKWKLFPVPIKDVVHNELVKAEFEPLKKLHTMPVTVNTDMDFYTAANYQKTALDADVIGHNIATFYCQMVDFPRLINQVYDDGARIFIELGPQSSCTKWVGETLEGKPHLAVGVSRKGATDHLSLLRMAAKLSSHGVTMNLARLMPKAPPKANKISLIKSVVLGKKPFASIILSDQNRALFKKVANTPRQPRQIKQTTLKINSSFNIPTLTRTPIMPANLLSSMFQHQANIAKVHAKFLQNRRQGLYQMSRQLLDQFDPNATLEVQPVVADSNPVDMVVANVPPCPIDNQNQTKQIFPTRYSTPATVIFNEKDLEEVAYGKISNVFGQDYAIIDTYPKRVMLPQHPYLLVSRVTEMNGVKGQYKPSTMTTEYDIPHNAWYSTDGQIPSCICIESGQCDLLLISYMGIDFENKGKYLYRLLDCTLTYLDDQPKEGQTLRYEISINSFAKHQNNLLFFFSYECFIGDKMILKMDGGCAGFFSEEELAVGKGVIHTNEEKANRAKIQKQSFTPILSCQKTTFDRQDIEHLMNGDLAACFADPAYDKQGKNPSIHFPLDKIMMVDRITSVDRTGGLWGLGEIWAEKDLQPDEWYFTSHFRDDPVMAGSLMSEGCVQLLQFFMMYLGFHTQVEDARFQTMRNIAQPIRCRGQVLPKDNQMRYRLEITEIGLSPKPYAKGNVDIYLGDKVIVDFRNVCLELSEKSAEERAMLASCGQIPQVISSPSTKPQPIAEKPALFTEDKIKHFATGDIVTCFGEEFAIYNKPNMRPPRTPNGYLQLMTRVLSVDGKRHELKKESSCVAEYDVPEDIFFCAENSYPSFTPYSMIMEIALQPNGFLTSHMGSTLLYPDTNLYFRNLDGTGELLQEIDFRGKTIVNKTIMYSTSAVMNNIIQKFTFELYCDDQLFYKGDAVFGFFTADSLSNQVGMDKGDKRAPWFKAENIASSDMIEMDLKDEAKNKLFQAPANKPAYKLAGGKLNFLDHAKIIPTGGKYGKGYVHSLKMIDPSDWFYPCHFHNDPVMPGSLGVESMIQSLQIFALQQDLGKDFKNPRFGLVLNKANWQYRGQIIPDNEKMTQEVHIKSIEMVDGRLNIIAEGELWKDDLRIYHIENIGVSILEG